MARLKLAMVSNGGYRPSHSPCLRSVSLASTSWSSLPAPFSFAPDAFRHLKTSTLIYSNLLYSILFYFILVYYALILFRSFPALLREPSISDSDISDLNINQCYRVYNFIDVSRETSAIVFSYRSLSRNLARGDPGGVTYRLLASGLAAAGSPMGN